MVDKKIVRNESVRSKMSNRSVVSQKSSGFRLIDHAAPLHHHHASPGQNDESSSVYSIYKQKIDSMFESDSSGGTHKSNSVQAKIEQMFSDVANDSGVSAQQMGVHAFSIDYLGSVPLREKVTSLAGLQRPLKDLYFAYKKLARSKKGLSGRLEISPQGLRVQYQGPAGDLEQMNSFPTIAVWSAVKFVIQEGGSMLHGKDLSYAFMPLITDPDNMDKQALFKGLEEPEKKYIVNEQHAPLFAVVMRKIGVQRQLECHGFVCQTSEDAIVIAATLYKALVNHMKSKERKPKNKNGVTTCMSTASSTMVEKGPSMPIRPPRRKRSSAASSICSDTNVSDTQPLLPAKPPKKSTKSKKAPKAPAQQDVDAIMPYEEPVTIKPTVDDAEDEAKPKSFSDKVSTYMSKEQKQLTAEIKQMVSDSNRGLKRVQSIRKRNEDAVRQKENSGDIFTKVTIPRSGSFLNTGGLTRYKNKASRNNESATGGSPLGFKEIFHELSMQEGLHSMDDILSVIIDPDGMSFNDLKPIYKEFLLKLAVTLTKDELYLKSKSIMRRQRKKTIKKPATGKKHPNKLVSGKFKRLKHIFQKSLKPPSGPKLLEGRSRPVELQQAEARIEAKVPESSISTSSYDTRPFRPKEELSNKKPNYRKKMHGDFSKARRRDRASTSEESDFFSLKRQQKLNKYQNMQALATMQNRNSSSGYVSCSECSYDSDTCTCISADKCYCSLGHRPFGTGRKEKGMGGADPSLTYCDCDTDSCAESNKCYCQCSSRARHAHHPKCRKAAHSEQHRKLCKNNSNTKSTRSLEYMSNPSEGYYERLRSKQKYGSERVHSSCAPRDLLQKKRRNSHSGLAVADSIVAMQNFQLGLSGQKMSAMDYELLKLARDGGLQELAQLQSGTALCANVCDYWHATRSTGTDPGMQKVQSAITTGACTDALSVKKSAEMAALFADIKLSQTTDITHLVPAGFEVDRRNLYNMEKSLQAKYSKPNKLPSRQDGGKVIQYSKPVLPPPAYGRPSSLAKSKAKMYAAKNGLYTIQSQSDESRHSGSRRSSVSGDLNNPPGGKRRVGSNLEDSLGYLP
ncbi:hypothetical protein HUJ04_001105 [Dendroctonus ponderosae]|uniref:PID domain-containing protein n=1 Tax=Dendroctonus ponderosae TaxID=77166 RepID=A0AAR5Q4S3_DENPD|nr:hypothetical protein HUJ04_001105 [Dendroctonus ponderosae]